MTQPHEPAPLRTQVRLVSVPEALLVSDKLLAEDVRLYGVLLLHADSRGACFPGRERLSQLCHFSQRSLDACVDRLVASGYLKTRRRWKDTRGTVYYEGGPGRVPTSTEYVLQVLPAQGTAESGGTSAPRDTAGIGTRRSTQVQELSGAIPAVPPTRARDPWELYTEDVPARRLATTAEGKPIPGSQNW
jgi:hypothetical protein